MHKFSCIAREAMREVTPKVFFGQSGLVMYWSNTRPKRVALKPVTDEQVFYDKFLRDKFYLPSARVFMQQIFYDKFPYKNLS